MKIGMRRSFSHTNDVLIPQLAQLVSARMSIVLLIVADQHAGHVNTGEIECPGASLLLLIREI